MTANTSSFSGIGDPNYTWVRLGAADGKAMKTYQDYTIKTTASQYDSSRKVWVPVATITACVRQSPNPLLWEEDQSLDIISWQVTYY